VVKKVPTYKWVVEDLCEECERSTGNPPVTSGVAGSETPYKEE
jgi:hypothetical protein